MATGADRADSSDIRLGALAGLVGYHLRRASTVTNNDFARALENTGVRQVLFGILSIVDANPGVSQGAVGRVLNIQRANMVSLINELVDRELIGRETVPGDRRAFSLRLSEAGRRTFDDCLARVRQHEDRVLAELDLRERATLIELLTRIEASERQPAA